MTGQWRLQPFSFSALAEFLPAYLNWLDPDLSLVENIRQVILAEGGMFLADPTFLLYDEVREPRAYLAVLKAIGLGYHTFLSRELA